MDPQHSIYSSGQVYKTCVRVRADVQTATLLFWLCSFGIPYIDSIYYLRADTWLAYVRAAGPYIMPNRSITRQSCTRADISGATMGSASGRRLASGVSAS